MLLGTHGLLTSRSQPVHIFLLFVLKLLACSPLLVRQSDTHIHTCVHTHIQVASNFQENRFPASFLDPAGLGIQREDAVGKDIFKY